MIFNLNRMYSKMNITRLLQFLKKKTDEPGINAPVDELILALKTRPDDFYIRNGIEPIVSDELSGFSCKLSIHSGCTIDTPHYFVFSHGENQVLRSLVYDIIEKRKNDAVGNTKREYLQNRNYWKGKINVLTRCD